MAIHKGALKKIGDGVKSFFTSSTIVTVLEIGNETLRNIRISPLMNTYLKDAVGSDTEFAVVGRWLCAIKLPDGRVVADDTINKHLLMVIFGWGLVTTPLFGIGLIFVGLSIYEFIRIKKQAVLVAFLEGAV